MRRLFIAAVGVISFGFGAAVLLDGVNLSTPRADKWAVIFSFAGVMFSLGVLSASKDSGKQAASLPDDDVALERSLRFVPTAPGSLRSTSSRRAIAPDADTQLDTQIDTLSNAPSASVAVGDDSASFVDLDAILDADTPAPISVSNAVSSIPEHTPEPETMTGQKAIEPVVELPVPSSINLDIYSDVDLITTVKKGERSVIQQMMARGQLTKSGPLSEQDIAMMIFLACTSDDLLVDLRARKATAQPVPARPEHSFAG